MRDVAQRFRYVHREPKNMPQNFCPYLRQVLTDFSKKLSYCWETVRSESKTKIAEMDVEMTT